MEVRRGSVREGIVMGRSERSAAWALARALLCSSLLVLAACGGTPAEPTVTVEGRVVSGTYGPLAGVLVHVTDRPLTTTDADGAFTIAGVSLPYTLTVGATGGSPWAHVFQDMTSLSPIVAPIVEDFALVGSELSGTVFAGMPLPATGRVVVCLEGIDFDVYGCALAGEGAIHYSLEGGWFLPVASAPVRVHAMWIAVDALGQPTDYPGYASVETTLAAGGSATLDLSPTEALASTPVQGAIGAAGGGIPMVSVVAVQLSGRLAMPVFRSATGGVALDMALPEIGTGRYRASTVASFASGGAYLWTEFAAGDGLDLLATPPPQLLVPAAGASDVSAVTEFRAEGGPSGARTFQWRPSGATGGPRVALTIMAGSARLPDLSPLSLAFVPGGGYRWYVTASGSGLDEAVLPLPGFPYSLLGLGGPGLEGDGTLAQTTERSFTLAP